MKRKWTPEEDWNIGQLYKLMKRAHQESDTESEHAILWAIYQLDHDHTGEITQASQEVPG